MRVGFTGTRTVKLDAVQRVCDFVCSQSTGGSEFTTGACVGFDAIAAHCLLDNFPDAVHRLVVPANQSQVDHEIIERFQRLQGNRHIIEYMPDGTTYRQRNERILHHADKLVAVAEFPELNTRSTRSGTWMTVRIARRLGLPVRELVIWPAA